MAEKTNRMVVCVLVNRAKQRTTSNPILIPIESQKNYCPFTSSATIAHVSVGLRIVSMVFKTTPQKQMWKELGEVRHITRLPGSDSYNLTQADADMSKFSQGRAHAVVDMAIALNGDRKPFTYISYFI